MKPEQLRRRAARDGDSTRWLGFGVAFFLGLGALVYGVVREAGDPRFDARISGITGLHRTEVGAVLRAAALPANQNAWLIDRRGMERRIEALPWVGSARVFVAWPNRVRIDVLERAPVARVQIGPSARSSRAGYVIDDEQRVLEVNPNPTAWSDLPVVAVEPPPSDGSTPGETLANGDVAAALLALRELRSLGLRISAIAVGPSTGISATTDDNLRVLFGADEDLARKTALFLAIAAKISTPSRIAYVDVRSVRAPTVLYR